MAQRGQTLQAGGLSSLAAPAHATGVSTLNPVILDALSLTRACRKMANCWLKERKGTRSVPSPIFLWERGGRGCLSFFSTLFNFCKLRFSETDTPTLSLVRERASGISSLAYSMRRTFKLETVFRQSLTRERASVRSLPSTCVDFKATNGFSTVSGQGEAIQITETVERSDLTPPLSQNRETLDSSDSYDPAFGL